MTELSDPSSQFHLVDKTTLTINGSIVTAWITAPNNQQGFPDYEYLDADVVVGSQCVDSGGAEYGVASQVNRTVIEQVMTSLRPTA